MSKALTNKIKLNDIIRIKDFGTNTAAFQAAIDALPAAGGTIDGDSGTYTGIGTLTVGSKRVHWTNFRSVNGLETSNVLPGNQTRVGPVIANGQGYMVTPDLIISAFSDANAILPALFLTKDSTVGVDGAGLAKIQWRGTSDAGQKNVDGGRIDSVIIDATRDVYTTRMGIHPHVDGNDESQPAMSWQDGVTVPAKDALAAITITSGGTGYIVGDTFNISSATGGTKATATVTKVSTGAVTSVSIVDNGYGFTNGQALIFTGGSGSSVAGTALVPSNQFMYGHGTLNTARKLLLNNEVVAEYDYNLGRTSAKFDTIEVQNTASPAAFGEYGEGIVNVGEAYYVRNIPTLQYDNTSTKVRFNRDFGHRVVSVGAAGSPYTMDGLPEILYVNANIGNVTITLPAANFFGTSFGSRVVIRRTDTSANTVTIQRAGTDTINGRTSVTLAAGAGDTFVSNGSTAWVMESPAGQAVNIRDYGAVGDGTTDDRAAFAAANTAGRAIYIPKPATGYTFSSPLAMTVPVEVDPSATWDQVTDGGVLSFTSNNPFQNGAAPVPTFRLGGRVFVGDAADGFSGLNSANPDEAGSWYGNSTNGASYVSRDAQFLSATSTGRIAITAVARSSDNNINPAWTSTIGVASHVVNDRVAGGGFTAGDAWGFIAEIQAEPGTNVTHGIEIGAKNKKAYNADTDPYLIEAGVTGVWCAGGGDANFGGSATGPADAAIVILRNNSSGLTGGGWMKGIVFTAVALQGSNGIASDPGRSTAIAMARGQKIAWYEPTNGNEAFHITSAFNSDTYASKMSANDGGGFPTIDFESTQGVFAKLRGSTSANADYVVLQSAVGAATVRTEGSSTNADLFLVPKGTGVVRFGTWTSNADAAVNGYITVKDSGGNTRKLATIA